MRVYLSLPPYIHAYTEIHKHIYIHIYFCAAEEEMEVSFGRKLNK